MLGDDVFVGCMAMLLVTPLIVVVQAWLLKWAWQLVLVPVFGIVPITMWQSVAACVILWIVGGAFKSSGRSKS